MPTNPNVQSDNSSSKNGSGVYEIKVKGHLDDRWLDWLEGTTIRRVDDDKNGTDLTILRVVIADQPALHGFLAKIRDLNLTLISVRRLSEAEAKSLNSDQHEDPGNHARHPRARRGE